MAVGASTGIPGAASRGRAAIVNFTFPWSLFEVQVMGIFARANLLCAKADEWRDGGIRTPASRC